MLNLAAFLLGNWVLVRLPFLPSLPELAMVLPVILLAMRFSSLRMLASLLAGSLLGMAAVESERALRLEGPGRVDVLVDGTVTGLPRRDTRSTRFMFHVASGEFEGRRLRVTWYQPPADIRAGQTWTLPLRLKPPAGAVNFDLFDYEQWLFVHRIHATGHVRSPGDAILHGQRLTIDSLRESLRDRVKGAVASQHLATFLALSLGDTSQLLPGQWDTLNATGTTHLLIVSGLHVGLIAALVFGATRLVGLPTAPSVVTTLVVTGCYAALSGWGLPVQRAYVMSATFLACLLLRRQVLLTRQFAVALLFVTFSDPLASLEAGYWLSFGAVLALITGLSNRSVPLSPMKRWWHTVTGAQWVVFLALLPVLGYLHQRLPVGSILVNLVAIPWVGLLLVPTLLAGLVCQWLHAPLGGQVLSLAGFLTDILWYMLSKVAASHAVLPVAAISGFQLVVALLGACLLLLPRGLVPRWPGVLLLALLPAWHDPVDRDQLRVTFLDVGQGLGVLVESDGGAVLYDTGPAFGEQFSAARQFVLPTLRRRGYRQLEALVLSHTDNDHAGGEKFLRRSIAVRRVFDAGSCQGAWQLGDAGVEVFALAAPALSNNDRSCLMQIRFHRHVILLTGDIEAAAELRLAGRMHLVTLMSVPHHGSRTSSTPGLLNALLPEVAVVATGILNRFDHPDEAVMTRYRQRHVRLFNTADTGAVEFVFDRHRYTVRTARASHPAIWRRPDAHKGSDDQ